MKLKMTLAALLALAIPFAGHAQWNYGFKTGLNFAHLSGPSETSDAGARLESWKNVTGFHIGMAVGYNFTDNYGVRGELLFSKKGGKYTFDGPSYRIFQDDAGDIYATGNSKYLINLNNSYLDLPIMAYARWGDFEISGGGYLGLQIGSFGSGSLTFENGVTSPGGDQLDKVQFNLDYNYRKDDPGEHSDFVAFNIDNRLIDLPRTLGAYYDYPEDRGRLYNTLDFGLIGGVAYYFSRSLYLGVRLQYGLADVTNNDADLAKARTGEGRALLFRDDKDRNVAVQASVGFSF